MLTIINANGLSINDRIFITEDGKEITYKVVSIHLNNGAIIDCKVKNLQMLLDCKIIQTIKKEERQC